LPTFTNSKKNEHKELLENNTIVSKLLSGYTIRDEKKIAEKMEVLKKSNEGSTY